MATRNTLGWALWGLGWLLKLLFALCAVALPLAGVWIASSLAAHHDGPLWASLIAGALCFPLLPIAWDLWATYRHRRRDTARPRVLTLVDRMVLRTLAINLVFVGGLLAAFPGSVFEALSTRGDWMLEHSRAAWATDARGHLFATAERLRWLHEATHENAYEELIDADLVGGDDVVDPQAGQTDPIDLVRPNPQEPTSPAVSPEQLTRKDGWPFEAELHPAAVDLPDDVETSYQAVAQYIAAQEPDPTLRIKALHDYVADRVAYDVPALLADRFPPQDADAVFERKTAVCAGYASLLAAMGKEAGVEIVVVVGDSRDDDGMFDGRGHAWNAAKVDDKWFLIDATWDAGYVNGDTFTKRYSTTYLFTPPRAFVASHLPDDPKWQLLPEPVSHGDFLRIPALRPNFSAFGFELLDPVRARHTVDRGQTLRLSFANPHRFRIAGSIRGEGDTQGERCAVDQARTTLDCTFDEVGAQQVVLFGPEGAYMGEIFVEVR